jgi:probable H4MPT-linked C1 transfer pathway protein
VRVWSTDGVFLQPVVAKQNYMKVAAANWHALATFVGKRYRLGAGAILIDVGSTTTDVIPVLGGVPVPEGKTDYDRLFTNELLYTGVRRTPLCAILPWTVAAELFATTLDAYLVLGMIPEDRDDCDTADGRPATKFRAHARLCRMYCGDPETIPAENVRSLAEGVFERQSSQIAHCVAQATNRLNALRPEVEITLVVSGSGEFLARRACSFDPLEGVSLSDSLGAAVSACAPAYALTQLPKGGRRPSASGGRDPPVRSAQRTAPRTDRTNRRAP